MIRISVAIAIPRAYALTYNYFNNPMKWFYYYSHLLSRKLNHNEVDLPKVMQLGSDRIRSQTQAPLFLSPSKKQTKLHQIGNVLFVLTAFFFCYYNLYLDL